MSCAAMLHGFGVITMPHAALRIMRAPVIIVCATTPVETTYRKIPTPERSVPKKFVDRCATLAYYVLIVNQHTKEKQNGNIIRV